MSEENKKISPEVMKEEPNPNWLVYVLGFIIIAIVAFLVLKWINPGQKKSGQTAQKTEVIVTIEAQVVKQGNGNFFEVNSLAGFTKILWNPETKFYKEEGTETTYLSMIAGSRVRVEGKPNGRDFEAKKFSLVKKTETKINNITPSPAKLPGTGITE